MTKLKNKTQQIVEFCVYKHFPFVWFLYSIPLFMFVFFCMYIIGPTRTRRNPPSSLKEIILEGILCSVVFFLPGCLSAFFMRFINKPVLKFNAEGFYYTPQLWSKAELYLWDNVDHIEIERYENKKERTTKIFITVHLLNQNCVSINESIIPINYNELVQIFKYRLKNVIIKD